MGRNLVLNVKQKAQLGEKLDKLLRKRENPTASKEKILGKNNQVTVFFN